MSGDSGIRIDQAGQHLWVVSPHGECDVADAEALSAAFDEVFAHGSTLVVDLSATTFIDSAVIGALVAAQQRADGNPSHELVVVAPPSEPVRRVLDLTVSGLIDLRDELPAGLTTRRSDDN
jgi:anti-anti-sigma factor